MGWAGLGCGVVAMSVHEGLPEVVDGGGRQRSCPLAVTFFEVFSCSGPTRSVPLPGGPGPRPQPVVAPGALGHQPGLVVPGKIGGIVTPRKRRRYRPDVCGVVVGALPDPDPAQGVF
ncbi:hypothetical protein GCM10009642_38750 [Nocardiopsis metallicus]